VTAPPDLRERVRRLIRREVPEVEVAPPEVGGRTLVVPSAYGAVYREGYEPQVVAALSRLVRPGDVCADLGANVGFFTLLLSRLAGPAGRVVAFEPRDDMAGYLERNLAGSTGIDVCRAAVSDGGADRVELHSGEWGTEVRSTILPDLAQREALDGRQVVTVPAVTLDDSFGPGERLDLVKVDIEGAESVVLEGAHRILGEQRPVFVVEFHRDVGWPIVGHLADAGYRFESWDGTRIGTPGKPDEVPSYFVALPA
jgi:FkbM family methyltransferase